MNHKSLTANQRYIARGFGALGHVPIPREVMDWFLPTLQVTPAGASEVLTGNPAGEHRQQSIEIGEEIDSAVKTIADWLGVEVNVIQAKRLTSFNTEAQALHKDADHSDGFSIIYAVEDDTYIVIEGVRVHIPKGSGYLFRSDITHGAAGYKEHHTRLFFSVNIEGLNVYEQANAPLPPPLVQVNDTGSPSESPAKKKKMKKSFAGATTAIPVKFTITDKHGAVKSKTYRSISTASKGTGHNEHWIRNHLNVQYKCGMYGDSVLFQKMYSL